ncbi:MAG: hypothetical protein LBQ21_07525 [Clostridiales Family XIII bacterium]|jgi:RNA polymerase sigma factor (sigma-70 family)|nr:hypothetical protein [Clostridiales Family XIII bacterium]
MTIKERLRDYKALCDDIRSMEDEIGRLYYKATLPTFQGDGVHVQSSKQMDVMGDIVAAYLDEAERLAEKLQRRKREQEDIEKLIGTLTSRERRLIRLRYFEGISWERVAVEMDYSIHWVWKKHGEILEKLKV